MSAITNAGFKWGENLSWAKANVFHGRNSLVYGLSATTLGCIKTLINEDSFSYKTLDLFQSTFLGLRSNQQYSIYSRKKDDDLGFDEVHRPHAANIGELACFIEKKINPIALPLTTALGNEVKESYHLIAHLANALWWRSRLFSQKISWKLFKHIPRLFQQLINSTNKNLVTNQISEIVSPSLGLIGFAFCGLFTPIKSWLKFKGTENKIIDSLASVGTATQHLIYFFKFTLPQIFHFQENNKYEHKKLFNMGICANALNIGLPIIDLLSFENGFLNKAQRLYKELASGFTMAFFSSRRYFMGKAWVDGNNNPSL